MKIAVIGMGFGDEGKGLVTDYICNSRKVESVTRYSGGHQAAHCVEEGDFKHIFSNFGSGTYRGVHTKWKAKTCYPFSIMNEYELLIDKMPKEKISMTIDPDTPVTTPYDIVANSFNKRNIKDGSVGVGFGETIQREENNVHLHFKDIAFPEVYAKKVSLVKDYYERKIDRSIEAPISQKAFDLFFTDSEKIYKLFSAEPNIDHKPIELFESSQGLLLDMDYGFFPNVTRSRVGMQELDFNDSCDEVFLVTRAYQTRHGNGYCQDEVFYPNYGDRPETNVTGEFQGDFKTRILDLDLLKYAIESDKYLRSRENINLVITCLDHITNGSYRYIEKGELYETKKIYEFIDKICEIKHFNQVYGSFGSSAENVKLIYR